ncbi:MAG: hypothetical protein CVU43_23950 [Chloroflexi bacterium HGW-Chloroflexi-5]|jgi:hypothetical protein|nr:MAG: hypothetical protein CVU43_23950 [Chloroflexi bacterium HGW-Chloroflexi-5]
MRSIAVIIIKGFCLGLLAGVFTPQQVAATGNVAQLSNPSRSSSASEHERTAGAGIGQEVSQLVYQAAPPYTIETQLVAADHPKRADFEGESVSPDAKQVADWVVDSRDNCRMPFVIIDKTNARVFVFHPDGRLRGSAPVLLGLKRGDDSVPDIGKRAMSDIRPEERITPAGRFVASLGRNIQGKNILWVDYAAAISLHQVVTNNPKERRLQRLATPTPLDKRISYGCINVPEKFYKNIVRPAFTGTNGIVYVLPETRSIREVFAMYDVDEKERQQNAIQPRTREGRTQSGAMCGDRTNRKISKILPVLQPAP